MIEAFAPAKLNLFLHVTGRRADGYHALESLVAFADIGDRLRAVLDDDLSLAVTGPFAGALAGEPTQDNLVLRAAEALRAALGETRGARLTLTKTLPVASGIGGGSADAAAALRALLALWARPAPDDLPALAMALGADVPVCLASAPAMMRGAGEAVTPLTSPPPPTPLLLVNPGVKLATPAVFGARMDDFTPPQTAPFPACADLDALIAALAATTNDLEPPARRLAPAIDATLAALSDAPGLRLARMSGSGATCFGLFADDAAARDAAGMLGATHPKWWIAAGHLLDRPPANL